MMRASRAPLALLLTVVSLSTASGSAERYRVVSAQTTPSLRRQLESATRDGFQVLGAALGPAINGKDRIVLLLERGEGAERPEYAVVRTSGRFDDPVDGKSVNAWAAEGFGFARQNLLTGQIEDWWVPESRNAEPVTLVLERREDSEPLRYFSVKITSRDLEADDLTPLGVANGRVVGMWNSGRALFVMVEAPLRSAAPVAAEGKVDDRFRLLFGTNRLTFEEVLETTVQRGYRIVEIVEQSIQAPPIVLLEREPSPAGTKNIQVIRNVDRKINRGKLEKKLNKYGRRGYRVIPGSITPGMLAFERIEGAPTTRRYRVFSSREPPGIPGALASAVDEGYAFLILLTNAGEDVVVVERRDAQKAD